MTDPERIHVKGCGLPWSEHTTSSVCPDLPGHLDPLPERPRHVDDSDETTYYDSAPWEDE